LKIVAEYSFNGGKEAVFSKYLKDFEEIELILSKIDAHVHKTKESKEVTMLGKILYSPKSLNEAFKHEFNSLNWHSHKQYCDYSIGNYLNGYRKPDNMKNAFREMDFIKQDKQLGVEVQFGKYAFMVYNVCAKMTIFKNLGIIDTGIEIVPVKKLADEMSTGVSYFEQFAWDLEYRGVSNIDTPVYIIGIDL
jgi:hypothetical protein